MPHRVLNEDWSDYDNRKKKGVDSYFFSCTESWEEDYLVKKIQKHYALPEAKIRSAIKECCNTVPGNKPRDKFVQCVMSKLK